MQHRFGCAAGCVWLIAGAEGAGSARARPGLPKAEAGRWCQARSGAALILIPGRIRQWATSGVFRMPFDKPTV